MQKHWDVMRSDDAGDNWHEVSGNLPTDFGFVIDVHAHEPETLYVVPIKSDSLHFPLEGKLRVYRSRTGGNEWEPLTKGLPQKDCYVNVLRDAMAVDSLDECGVYFGTTGGQVYASADAGDNWTPIVRDLPACSRSRCRRWHERPRPNAAHDPGDSALPSAQPGACGRGGCAEVAEPVTMRRVLDALEAAYPMLRGTIREYETGKRRAFLRFFACEEDWSHEPVDASLPRAVAEGKEPLLIIGAIAGG